jgi:four helix bundle suffix protein
MSNTILTPHGGYRNLLSYQTATIIYDFTVEFTKKYIDYKSRTIDQMVQAARSGKQNIAEGSTVSGTSKKTEIKLIQVARGSQEELLQDYEDFLRQHNLTLWDKDDHRTKALRALAYRSNRSYKTYETYMETPEGAANCAICLIHQTNYLLDQQIRTLEKEFLEKGGFTERLYQARKSHQ